MEAAAGRVERTCGELDPAACWRLLSRAGWVRVAYSSAALPALSLVPLVPDPAEGGALVFGAPAGSALARAGREGVVTVQADAAPGPDGPGWWVTATGPTELVPDGEQQAVLLAALAAAGGPLARQVLVRVRVGVVTGQRF